MNRYLRICATTLLTALLCIYSTTLLAQDKKKQEKKKPEKKESAYEKLFKNKSVETASGKFATLHKMDAKIYLELPLKHMGEDMLLGTTISSVSEPTFITVGMKNTTPIYLRFERQDSSVVMKSINSGIIYDKENPQLSNAVQLNYRDPSVAAFKIEAYTPDSSAVIFNMTSFLGTPNPMIPLVPKHMGIYSITSTPKPELSFIKTVKSFDNNASVKTELNYTINATIMGIVPVASDVPLSIEATYTLLLLPKEKMTPRIADTRVGIFSSGKASFTPESNQITPLFFAHRWKLVPNDIEAYHKGELTEPREPIVFYLDNTFPEEWKEPVREGVLRWNKAFEKAGFKNAIQVKDFPKDDPNFDPDNLNYSCIRYIPTSEENAMGPSWVDPATGEIINASVFVYNNVEQLLHKWRFIQTANVDTNVRGKKLPKHIFNESLSYVVAHEVGHTLGLMHNMAASAAYPTDSLRSATFTKKHGTTASIMDYARYNYVAQPSDKNVTLTPPELGVYDHYAIEWNYRYFPTLGNDINKEAKQLEVMVDAKQKDPMYRYGREQNDNNIFDPTAVAEDLGNDPIKSSNYGIKNLQNISKNLPQWITNDEDSKEKDKLYLAIAQQHHRYLKNGLNMVGGMQFNSSKESSGIPRYQVVPKKKQREALLWSINQVKNFHSYANRDLESKGFINVSYYDQLLEYITGDLFKSRARVIVASHIDPKSYSLGEFFDDLYKQIFKSTLTGTTPTASERFLERYFVNNALAVMSGSASAASPSALTSLSTTENFFTIKQELGHLPTEYKQAMEPYKFGNPSTSFLPNIDIKRLDSSPMYFYGALQKLLPILKSRASTASSTELKAHYQLLLFKVEKVLDNKK
ncbi:MAG: zinc-dependent metalloprotease [Bacteroidia bacterium]|nr:zinc-dependent metalloprotease [Bacteroidia bacterium]